MRAYLNALLELVYPSRCPSCLKLTEGGFCARCARLLPTVGNTFCRRCAKPTTAIVDDCRDCRGRDLYFDSARAAWIYEGAARDVIHAYKYANQKSLAPALAGYLAPLVDKIGLITWVPLTRHKTWNRGCNQAKLLATNLARETGLPAVPLLRRVRATKDQNQLDISARKTNVKDAFGLQGEATGADIILVDDVYTTGSTVAECAKTLKAGGAATVRVVTLARTTFRPATDRRHLA